MVEMDHPTRIVNIDDDQWSGEDEDGSRWKQLGQLAGGDQLGCSLEEILPGGQPSAYHYHLANEEAMYVVEGTGLLRTPAGQTPVSTGDYVAFPAGETGAHSVENSSDAVLKCLFFSTMHEPEVLVHPDDERLFVIGGAAIGRPVEERTFEESFHFPGRSEQLED